MTAFTNAIHRSCLAGILSGITLLSGPVATARDSGLPVSITEAKRQQIFHEVQLTGSVTAQRAARLSVSTSGLVKQLVVDTGSRVAAGDTLLQLDDELISLQVSSAEARHAQARMQVEDAQRRLREARKLLPQRSVAETVVRDLEAEVAQDDAVAQQLQADALYQRGLRDRHTLRAPFNGVISAKLTEAGEWVSPGQAVLELVATEVVYLDFPVAEDFLPALQQGGRVRYTLGADSTAVFSGEVDTVVPVTDPGARTFLLRVVPNLPHPQLTPGVSVRATLELATGREALVVPRDATVRLPDGRAIVWSVETIDGVQQAKENPVQIGLQFGDLVEISQGLDDGAKVVIEGNETLRAGQALIIRSPSIQARGE